MKLILLTGMACLAATPTQERTIPWPPAPLPFRVAESDVIVVGKVTGLSDGLVFAAAPFGPGQADYRIAIVGVEQAVAGVRGVKEIRVGFVAPPAPAGRATDVPRAAPFTLRVGQEGLLFLRQLPAADFYVGENYYDIAERQGDPRFDKAVEAAGRYAKLLEDPGPALTGADAGERLLAAALLVARWRGRRPGMLKMEPVSAERSRQVLRALAEADWDPAKAPIYGGCPITPHAVFLQLGLGADDGWTPPGGDAGDLAAAAQRWLRAHAGEYRIQRVVADTSGKK